MSTKRRILIVDDQPQIGRIFGLKLRLSGYDVVSTTSGAESIELVRNQKFDVMLLDMIMPDINGDEVMDQIRTFSQIPIILFTANHQITESEIRSRATDFILKPVAPEYLIEKVNSVLARWAAG